MFSKSEWLLVAVVLFAIIVAIMAFVMIGRRLAAVPRSWEPNASNDFRRRVGFVKVAEGSVGATLAHEQRETLLARIRVTTDKQPPDRRVKRWPHANALEFRCRWTGREWVPAPPMFDRAEVWVEGIAVSSEVEQNRQNAGMRDCDDALTDCENSPRSSTVTVTQI